MTDTAHRMSNMATRRRVNGSASREVHVQTPLLPPTDRGKGAWMVLLGCVLVQGPVWGYSTAFGIFQNYYASNQILASSDGNIAVVGNTQQGIMYLMMPAAFAILTKYPQLRRWCGPLGLILTTASLLASAYATTVGQLLATQGVAYAIGCGLLFTPTSLYLDEWFQERKGLAYGFMWAGKSLVGVAMPFVMSAMLGRFGARTTLQAWAVASAVLTMPLLVLLKPRVPWRVTAEAARQRPLSLAFLKHAVFWMLQVGNILQSLGYMLPSTYLASYAHSIGLPDIIGPVLLATFSCASAPGGVVIGVLGDHMSASNVTLVSSIGSALAVFLLWGLSQQVAVLILFSITYGFFAGAYSSAWSGILNEMKRQDTSVDTGLVFGMLMGGRGLGFVLSGPMGSALLGLGGLAAEKFSGYATQYGPMIVCTGLTATLGAWAWFWDMGGHLVRLL